MTGRGIFGELVIGLGAIIVAMLVVAVLVWGDIGKMQVANDEDDEAWQELTADTAVLEAMVNQGTGLRRYLATGDPRFLRIYEVNRDEFHVALRRLAALTADDPVEMRRRTADIPLQARTWTDTVATPLIRARQAGPLTRLDFSAGQAQEQAIRGDIAILRQGAVDLLNRRNVLQREGFRQSRWTLVLGSGLALIFALLIGGRSFGRLISARRSAEATAAELADALDRAYAAERAKTRFLSNMSHEMRTPLNGVAGMAEALGRTQLAPEQREFVDVIRFSAETLEQLIGDLLCLSRGGEAHAQPSELHSFHLGDALRAAAEEHRPSAEAKGLELRLVAGPEIEVRVVGDLARLRQIGDCLISNAVKFTDRGHVRLTLRGLAGDRFMFVVADTGIGFDDARKAELFEPFSQSDDSATRRHGGAGLGLAVARQLTADLGGRLDCSSRPGEGSLFTFEIALPSADAAEAGGEPTFTEASSAEPNTADGAALRVLVVDDNGTNRKLLELFLEQLGVEWVSAEDGQQAVDAVRAQAFAAILMDIQMPVMDGLTATREIRHLERETGRAATPVIIVSANGEPEHVRAGREAGAQLHLTKPVSAQSLVDALNMVLDEPAAAHAA